MTNPGGPRQLLKEGLAEHKGGNLDRAREIYRQLIEIDPDQADAQHLLGVVQAQLGNPGKALPHLRRAIVLAPANSEFTINTARILKDVNRHREAEACLEAFLSLRPQDGPAEFELARLLGDRGDLEGAEAHYRKALDPGEDLPPILDALAGVLIATGREPEGEACLRRALDIDPRHGSSLSNLGQLLADRGDLDEAVECLRKVVEAVPDSAVGWFALGNVLRTARRFDETHDAYDRSLVLQPEFAEAHMHKGMAWLHEGSFGRGWEEYEWRWRATGFPNTPAPGTPWDGSPLAGRNILLTGEQGLGDMLLFVRYASLVAERGGRVTLQVPLSLARLFRTVAGVRRVVPANQPAGEYDFHAPLMSLPRLFGTTVQTIPARIPYLAADEDLVGRWRRRLAEAPGLTVGLVWRGFARNRNDRNRSCPAEIAARLREVPGVRLFSLVKDPGPDDTPLADGITDLADGLGDFADTAAAISCLDLVISVDTAAAHLAGAMGRPVWLMLTHAADWRWLLDRDDSPWYPTMRLYRQDRWGNWDSVVERISADLGRLAATDKL